MKAKGGGERQREINKQSIDGLAGRTEMFRLENREVRGRVAHGTSLSFLSDESSTSPVPPVYVAPITAVLEGLHHASH